LYVDFAPLRDRAGGSVSEALGICLRALGVDDRYLPASLEQLTALYRRQSGKRRLLVVLDGVSKAAQVRPLIPQGSGSVVLVTSRGRLGELVAIDGAHRIELEPLDGDSGLRLLADRCARAVADDPAAARRLVKLSGGLPVALHVLAARLLTNRWLTIAALADELSDETRRLAGMSLRGEHGVSAVLTLAYRELPPEVARLYRLLGWLPGRTFGAATAAAAGGVDLATAERLLGDLVEAGLLDEPAKDRMRMQDLVRLHARERAADEEPTGEQGALVERVITHYLAQTALADRALRADRLRVADLSDLLAEVPDPFRAEGGQLPLDWLEAERTNILAVLREADRRELHTPVWQLAEVFTVLFLHRRHLADWQESLELGARAAAAVMVPAAEARLRSVLSRPLMDFGAYGRAREELDQAIACAEVAGPGYAAVSASVQEFDGRYWDRFDQARAVRAYQRSAELNAEAGVPRGVAIATYFLGCALDAQGDHEAALRTLEQARQSLLSLPGGPDERMAARALAAIGTVHEHLGDTATALHTLAEAARILPGLGGSHYAAETWVTMADLTERTGGPRESVRDNLSWALAVYEAGGSPAADALRERLERLDSEGPGA
jgi:tetratricopeptide (TPR) repeat protein